MRKVFILLCVFFVGFSASSIEIGLDLVSHLEIETEAELDVIVDLGCVSLMSSKDLEAPFSFWPYTLPWTFWLPTQYTDGRTYFESYTDIYLGTYGNDLQRLLDFAIPVGTQMPSLLNQQEVYLFQGNITGRDTLATILGMDDYFDRKAQYEWGDYWAGYTKVFVFVGAFAGVAGLIHDDPRFSVMGGIYLLIGGVFGLITYNTYPDEPLWDHDEVRREIIRYNNKILAKYPGET